MKENDEISFERMSRDDQFDDYYMLKCDTKAVLWSGFADKPDRDSFRRHFDSLIRSDAEVIFVRVNGETAGYIKFDISPEGVAEVGGYSVLERFAGRGLGKTLIAKAVEILKAGACASSFVAWVSERNAASLACFGANGFKVVPDTSDLREMRAMKRTDRFILLEKDL